MITFIRKKIKSKRQLQAIIWLSVFALSVLFSPELVRRITDKQNWALKVNSIKVTPQEFMQRVQEYRQRLIMLEQQFGVQAQKLIKMLGSTDPNEYAYQESIKNALMEQVAKSLNISIDPEFLNQEILKMLPPGLIDESGKVDFNALSVLLNYPSAEVFEKSINQYVTQSIINDIVEGAVFVPQFELKNLYDSFYTKRKYSILIFPFEKYVREAKKSGVTADQLEKYFQLHSKQNRYLVPEKRMGRVWTFTPSAYSLAVTDKEVENYYEKNKKSKFLEHPAQTEVRQILFSLKDKQDPASARVLAQKVLMELKENPSKFEEYAKKYSDDLATKTVGGLVGFVAKGEKDPIFDHYISTLKNNGDISDIFETEEGLVILQRISKRGLEYKKMDLVKEEIKQDLQNQKFKNLFTVEVKRVKAKNEDFNAYAKSKNINPMSLNLVELNLATSKNQEKLFDIKDVNDFVFYMDGNKGYVIQLLEIQKSYKPTLEQVKDVVEKDYYQEKAKELMKNEMGKAKEQSLSHSFEKLKEIFGIKLKVTPLFNQDSTQQVQDLQESKIPVQKLFEINQKDQIGETVYEEDGYLYKIDEIETFNQVDFLAKKPQLEHQVYRERKRAVQDGFIASLQKNATIKVNEKLLSKQVKQLMRK